MTRPSLVSNRRGLLAAGAALAPVLALKAFLGGDVLSRPAAMAEGGTPNGGCVAATVDTLRCVGSLHVAALATISIWDVGGLSWGSPQWPGTQPAVEPGEPVEGYLEYWTLGDRYRINSWVDPAKLPGLAVQVAYDGERFQVLLPDGTLSVSGSGDRSWALPVLADPVLELLALYYPLADENAQFVLRFKDVQQQEPAPVDFAAATWELAELDGEPVEHALFPGAVYEGRAYGFRVYVPAHTRQWFRRIERIVEGSVLTSSDFADYQAVATAAGTMELPRQVTLRAFNEGGQVAISISYTVIQVEADIDIPPEVFIIGAEQAARIWDDDGHTFLP